MAADRVRPAERGRWKGRRRGTSRPSAAPDESRAADAYGRRSRLTEEQILDRLRAILPERTGRDVRVLDSEWLSEFTIHRRLADRYRRGRVLIAGDAAHAHAPFGGQGMLTGLGDAENLAWKLALVARGRAADALLDTYEAERRPLATDVLRGTANVTKVNVARSPVGRFLRDQVLIRLFNQPWVQRWVTFTTSQLWASYRSGPWGSAGPSGWRPGSAGGPASETGWRTSTAPGATGHRPGSTPSSAGAGRCSCRRRTPRGEARR